HQLGSRGTGRRNAGNDCAGNKGGDQPGERASGLHGKLTHGSLTDGSSASRAASRQGGAIPHPTAPVPAIAPKAKQRELRDACKSFLTRLVRNIDVRAALLP